MSLKNPLVLFTLYHICFKLSIILVLTLIIFLLREKLYSPSWEYRYRVKHFTMNWILIIIYMVGYFGLVFWLRIRSTSANTDLNPYLKQVKDLYYYLNTFDFVTNSSIIILLLINIIYLLACTHKFFLIQLTKRFLILHVRAIYDLKIDFHQYLLLFRMIRFFERMIFDIIAFMVSIISVNFYNKIRNNLWQILWRIVRFSIITLPTIILYLFFFYNIIYNSFVISTTFYKYLLFYFIYFTYRRIHFFVDESDLTLNTILYRMYYLERSYWYVNIPEEYQHVLSRYLNLGLSRNMSKYPEPLLDEVLGHYSWFMETECCAYSKDGRHYFIGSQGFTEENNDRKDTIIDYKFMIHLPKKIKDNINRLSLYVIASLILAEILLLFILKYSTMPMLFQIAMYVSNMLLLLIPLFWFIYSLGAIIIISRPTTLCEIKKGKTFPETAFQSQQEANKTKKAKKDEEVNEGENKNN